MPAQLAQAPFLPTGWIASRHESRAALLRPVSASELLDSIASLSESRESGASGNGVVRGRLLSGVEYAEASTAAERSLRAAWRKRHGGKATPLVLIADSPEGEDSVVVLGPLAADGPLRTVRTDALQDLIERTATLSDLRAVRLFAQEVERLDASGIPGLVVRGLGTRHLFENRLPQSEQWERLRSLAEGMASGDWLDTLRKFGYQVEQLKARGYLVTHEGRPVAIVHPQASAEEFSRLDESGTLREGALLTDCLRHGANFGILAAGARMRLFETSDHQGGVSTRYLEIDAALLDESAQPLLGLLSPEYLAQGGLAELLTDARDYGAKLRIRLDRELRQEVLPRLGRELGRWAEAEGRDLTDEAVRNELEGACLSFVFRALFLLFAESAGFLPMTHDTYRQRSMTRVCERAAEELETADPKADTLWDDISRLVKAMRTGQTAWGVPAYNGDLFSVEGLPGAEVLEVASITDRAIAPALVALARDSQNPEMGVDFSGLEIGHVGHIYEGLLSLRLSLADQDFHYDERRDRYVAPGDDEEADVSAGDLIWLTNEGGRKGGGVYYTRTELVRHLVKGAVRPALETHLENVRDLAKDDPSAAARQLFEFHVLDPSCGSAHFLVEVVGEIADRIAEFLGETPLPAIADELEGLRATVGKVWGVEVEDAALLKRLVLKRCAFGVDISPMGAEIAKLSLWLATFVPGLALSYLERNIRVGNSLIGVSSSEEVADAANEHGQMSMIGQGLRDALREAALAADALQQIPDRTPEEIARSREKAKELEKTVEGARAVFDLWTAGPLGHPNAREEALQHGAAIIAGDLALADQDAIEASRTQSALHWPIAFPETFAREKPGFDVVVGNPPWEEVTVEELAFYARYRPGLRGMPARERRQSLADLQAERPELATRLEAEKERLAQLRAYLGPEAGYTTGAGDPDVYKYFCQRYRDLLRDGGCLGVVLPRSAFLVKGSEVFREWLLTEAPPRRVDFLLNRRNWMFDTHPQYTVALVSAQRRPAIASEPFELAGVAASAAEFETQVSTPGIVVAPGALGPGHEFPLCPDQTSADLLTKLSGTRFALGGGRWRCFPVAEFHETNDKGLWEGAKTGWPLWKGESFDQFDPHGGEARWCSPSDRAMKKALKPRPGSGSLVADGVSLQERREAVERTVGRARVAFRDVTRATDSRTVRACLIPPETFLLNSAPYLTFVDDDPNAEAACLAVMNSLLFDWQARRYVETHVNFFVLELFKVPRLGDGDFARLAELGARLSCVDGRFAEFAKACGVDYGPLTEEEQQQMRSEIDALVARAWALSGDELEIVFSDFTGDAVSPEYRQAVRSAFDSLGT